MANICSFQMCVRGNHSNIEKFYDALSQKGKIWMGRGAEAELKFESEDRAFIIGWCKWSVQSALMDDAISMRTEPETWHHEPGEEEHEYITLYEACKKWSLDMEVYSEEGGCCFQEHYVFVDGDLICEECEDWYEYYLGDYETKEEAEEELNIEITDKEWAIFSSDYLGRGGFENWDFEI